MSAKGHENFCAAKDKMDSLARRKDGLFGRFQANDKCQAKYVTLKNGR